ncbi:MAG: hypothetical protein AAGF93_11690 [Cyanobacteria bacterium P01_H01_bin.105]
MVVRPVAGLLMGITVNRYQEYTAGLSGREYWNYPARLPAGRDGLYTPG